VRGLERLVDRTGEIGLHGVKVYDLPQPRVERGHQRFGVITGPVEVAVHGALDPAAQRVEQRRGHQRGGRDRHRRLRREQPSRQDHQAGEYRAEDRRDDRVGDNPADDAVDCVHPVLQHRDGDADRQSRRPDGADEVIGQLAREDDGGHAGGGTAAEPLELLTAHTAGSPESEYLRDNPGRPARQDPDEHDPAEDHQRPRQRADEVTA
jgi:hypothetical protein